jgi:hypothetical protein
MMYFEVLKYPNHLEYHVYNNIEYKYENDFIIFICDNIIFGYKRKLIKSFKIEEVI